MIRYISMIHVTLKIYMPDLTPSESRTPERLIAGIVAGLASGMTREIVLVVLEGSVCMPWGFFWRVVGGMAGGE